jgi:hypothetical protein
MGSLDAVAGGQGWVYMIGLQSIGLVGGREPVQFLRCIVCLFCLSWVQLHSMYPVLYCHTDRDNLDCNESGFRACHASGNKSDVYGRMGGSRTYRLEVLANEMGLCCPGTQMFAQVDRAEDQEAVVLATLLDAIFCGIPVSFRL